VVSIFGFVGHVISAVTLPCHWSGKTTRDNTTKGHGLGLQALVYHTSSSMLLEAQNSYDLKFT
jgi:hypothetical protein